MNEKTLSRLTHQVGRAFQAPHSSDSGGDLLEQELISALGPKSHTKDTTDSANTHNGNGRAAVSGSHTTTMQTHSAVVRGPRGTRGGSLQGLVE